MMGAGGHPRAWFGVHGLKLLLLPWLSHLSEPEPSPQVGSRNGVCARMHNAVSQVTVDLQRQKKKKEQEGVGTGIQGPGPAPKRAP